MEQVDKWIKRVWIAYFALAIAISVSFYMLEHERSHRIYENTKQIKLIRQSNRVHDQRDAREAATSVKVDCDNARRLRAFLIEEEKAEGNALDAPGLQLLNEYVLKASRNGCTLK